MDAVAAWLTSARHPRYGRPYDELTYTPMQELLRYLGANGFKNFIVSGGGADFIRVWVGARLRHPTGAGCRLDRTDDIRAVRQWTGAD